LIDNDKRKEYPNQGEKMGSGWKKGDRKKGTVPFSTKKGDCPLFSLLQTSN